MTGSRIESPTNLCMRQWIRMVAPAQPEMILMENGYQLASEKKALLLKDLTDVLDHYGYYWWTWMFFSYQIGCPQIRRRMFLCATLQQPVREDLLSLQDLPQGGKELCPIGPWIWDLQGVEPSMQPVTTRNGTVVDQHGYDKESTYNQNLLIRKYWDRLQADYITVKEWERSRDRAAGGDERAVRDFQRLGPRVWPECPKVWQGMQCHRPFVLNWNDASHAVIGAYKYVHPIDQRLLTFRELERLMGYPDTWRFHKMQPHLIAQGIPVHNAYWAADRMLKIVGLR